MILARLFHDRPERITLEFSSPASDIHRLVLDPFVSNKRGIDYTTTPNCFYYFVENTDKHPWLKTAIDPWDFPMFSLSNAEEMITTEADWKNRDTVFGLGSDLAHVRFAQLLLNASYPDNFINEYALEGEAGFRGVAPTSAELHIWLPGSIGYDTALSQETEP